MQKAFGTLHVAVHGRNRIVAASDSRGHLLEDGPAAKEYQKQSFQKLFQSGRRSLCATGGILTLPDTYVSPLIGAICNTQALEDSPKALLEAIRDEMLGRVRNAFLHEPLPDMPSIFCAFSIRRKNNGAIDFWELDFPIQGSALGDPVIFSRLEDEVPGGPFAFSICAGVPENLLRSINADATDDEVLRTIDDAFEGARALNESARNEIGGPIDVAAIEFKGFRWLRRKPMQLPSCS